MFLRERSFLFSQGGSVTPKKEEGIDKEQVAIAAENAEPGVDEIVCQVVRVTHDAVDTVFAEHLVSYEHAFRDEVDEAPEEEENEADAYLDGGRREEDRGNGTEEYDEVPYSAPRKSVSTLAETSLTPL